MLGCLSILTVIVLSVATAIMKFSFWWVLIPAFIAGSFSLSNSPAYDSVIRANTEGRLGYFPTMLAIHIGQQILIAAAAYWITVAIAT